MAQIAAAAGISRPAVSYILNNSAAAKNLRPETIRKVQMLAREMGYSPNDAARTIKTGKSRTLAFITPPLRWDSNFAIVYAAAIEAFNLGYQVRYLPLSPSDNAIKDCIRVCRDFFIPAAACLNIPKNQLQQLAKEAEENHIHLAQVGDCFPDMTSVSVVADHATGCREVITYLYELGHRNIAFMLNSKAYSSSIVRFEAFERKMIELGIPPADGFVREGQFTPSRIAQETLALIHRKPRPTAIICDTDPSAITVLTTLQRHGIRVPEEISVTGFVDLPVGEFSNPRLTSVSLPAEQLGQQVVRQLVEWCEIGSPPQPLDPLPVSLVVRDSTGPAH